MIRPRRFRTDHPLRRCFDSPFRDQIPVPISVSFVLGILIGSLFGSFSVQLPTVLNQSALLTESASASVLALTWHAARYTLLALAFSTGYLGLLFLPLLAGFRGFSLSCAVSALLSESGFSGFLSAFCSLGIPAFAELPCFLWASSRCMESSASLLPRYRGSLPFSSPGKTLIRVLLPVAFLCAFDIVYFRFLLPLLISRL